MVRAPPLEAARPDRDRQSIAILVFIKLYGVDFGPDIIRFQSVHTRPYSGQAGLSHCPFVRSSHITKSPIHYHLSPPPSAVVSPLPRCPVAILGSSCKKVDHASCLDRRAEKYVSSSRSTVLGHAALHRQCTAVCPSKFPMFKSFCMSSQVLILLILLVLLIP